ncbi:hypothetical protein C5F49_07565 [Nitrosopumilus oxyclinae]|uniref:Uncharacterized protein n=1 Tax=Nitrosopumilus oxyclinae TaxID=1959104 RepID=A0A7D5M3E2_9ARCH|nr:hypothetical protein [Nitrosopumilus oxyclinae]QLH05195.1 hypothetical protein C5F49_07565 [Nitrosopumilus oxyclinae]
MKKSSIAIIISITVMVIFVISQTNNYSENAEYKSKRTEYIENASTVTVTGILQHWKPIDGPSYAVIPEEEMNVNMNNGRIFLYGEKLSPSLHDKKVTVTGKLIESYVDFQLETLGMAFGGDPDSAAIFVSGIEIIENELNSIP